MLVSRILLFDSETALRAAGDPSSSAHLLGDSSRRSLFQHDPS